MFRPSRTWARSAASDCRPRPSPVLERVEVRVRHPGPVHRALVAGLASGEDGEPDGHEDGDDGVIQDHSLVRRSENEEGHRPVSDCHEQRRRTSSRGSGYIVIQTNWSLASVLWRGFRAGAGTPRLRRRRVVRSSLTRPVRTDRMATPAYPARTGRRDPLAPCPARDAGRPARWRAVVVATRLPRSSERSWRPGPWALARRRRTPSRPRRAT